MPSRYGASIGVSIPLTIIMGSETIIGIQKFKQQYPRSPTGHVSGQQIIAMGQVGQQGISRHTGSVEKKPMSAKHLNGSIQALDSRLGIIATNRGIICWGACSDTAAASSTGTMGIMRTSASTNNENPILALMNQTWLEDYLKISMTGKGAGG